MKADRSAHSIYDAVAPPYTPETLAERWCCSSTQVRKLIRAGNHLGQRLRAFQIGHGVYRIPRDAVGEFESCGLGGIQTAGGTPSMEESVKPSKRATETPPSDASKTLRIVDQSREEARLKTSWRRT